MQYLAKGGSLAPCESPLDPPLCMHGTSSLRTLSASAFIELSLHQLDFSLEFFFYVRLVSVHF